jgi:hypothetical protein
MLKDKTCQWIKWFNEKCILFYFNKPVVHLINSNSILPPNDKGQ